MIGSPPPTRSGQEPGGRADRSPDKRRARFYGAAGETFIQRHQAKDGSRVPYPGKPGDGAEKDVKRQHARGLIADRRYMKICGIAENCPDYRYCRRRRAESGNGDAGLEPAHQFFEHEHRAGNRRVEGRSKPGASPRCQQNSVVREGATRQFAQPMRNRGTHLDARTFAAQSQSGTDCQEAAQKLDWDQNRRRRSDLAQQRSLDMRDTAARGIGREPTHQPRRRRDRSGRNRDDQQKPADLQLIRPTNKAVARTVGRFERKPKYSAYQPGAGTCQRREHCEQ